MKCALSLFALLLVVSCKKDDDDRYRQVEYRVTCPDHCDVSYRDGTGELQMPLFLTDLTKKIEVKKGANLYVKITSILGNTPNTIVVIVDGKTIATSNSVPYEVSLSAP